MLFIYQYLFLFSIYAFMGWCTEVCYCSIKTGKFVNRGFLNGPVCPIYGFGMLIIISALQPIADNLFFLFIGSMVLCSFLEYITGFAMKKLFHTTWWDYTEKPFNLGGYICLEMSIYWGIGGVLMMRLIHPVVFGYVNLVNLKIGTLFLMVFYTTLIIDFVATVLTIAQLNKDLKQLNDIAQKLHQHSEKLAERLGNAAIKEDLKLEENAAKLKERHAEIQAEIAKRKSWRRDRLMKAFPKMKHTDFQVELEEIKNSLGWYSIK